MSNGPVRAFLLAIVLLAGCGSEKPRCEIRFWWGRLALMRHHDLAFDEAISFVNTTDEAFVLAHKLNCEIDP